MSSRPTSSSPASSRNPSRSASRSQSRSASRSGASKRGVSSGAVARSSLASASTNLRSSYGGANPSSPLYAFIGLCLCAAMYAASAFIWAGDHLFTDPCRTYMFVSLAVAEGIVLVMIMKDYFFLKNRFTFTSLTVSLFYCGSIGMLANSLLYTFNNGAKYYLVTCGHHGIFDINKTSLKVAWILAFIGVALQSMGHFYFG